MLRTPSGEQLYKKYNSESASKTTDIYISAKHFGMEEDGSPKGGAATVKVKSANVDANLKINIRFVQIL